MDSGGMGNPSAYKRKFNAYTLAHLENIVNRWEGDTSDVKGGYPDYAPTTATIEAMKEEIAARKDGRSVPYKVPQI